MKNVQQPKTSTPTTAAAVARMQSAVARANNGAVPKNSHVGRMQRAVAARPPKAGK
jgi:hypothetical protein